MRNGYCFLVEHLPDSIVINGIAKKIDTRATTAIAIHLKLQEDCDDLEKAIYTAKKLFFGQPYEVVKKDFKVENAYELDKSMMTYISGAPEVKTWNELSAIKNGASIDSSGKESKLPDFDFKQDSGSIMAAFRQVYHLSLDETCNLHWWEFLELFSNLPAEGNTFMVKRHIRSMRINSKDSLERKTAIKEAKKAVKLKDTRSPEQKKAELQEQLNNLSI
ncbi:MAG: Gp15 family bacteriophage protein [Sphaerochaeta sp.]